MPTVMLIRGWRLFFYSNEGTEPMHIHAEKGGAEAKSRPPTSTGSAQRLGAN